MNYPKLIQKETYYIISDQLDWEQGVQLFIGREKNMIFQRSQEEGFVMNVGGEPVPMNVIGKEMFQSLQSKQQSPILKDKYHYDPIQTISELNDVLNAQLFYIYENIFEEVRKEHFPHQISRFESLRVIPKEREALQFWMNEFKTPKAKIYELSLTGKIHRSISEVLALNTIPPIAIKENAYRYWLGNMGNNAPNDECIFQGAVKVEKIIDANSIKVK